MKYKVGDKVTIKNDLNFNDDNDEYCVMKEMIDQSGKQFSVAEVGSNYYRLDGINFYWTDEMLEQPDLYYVQVEPNDYGFLNEKAFLGPELGNMLNATSASARKSLKQLRKYSQTHDFDITKVKFVPVKTISHDIDDLPF